MGVLSDRQIEREVKITPFQKDQIRQGVISSGLSSFGYDVRAGYKFQIFTDVNCSVIDPKAFDKQMLVDVDLTPHTSHNWSDDDQGRPTECKRCGVHYDNPYKDTYDAECFKLGIPNYVLIPPNSFALAETLEYLEIPRDTLAIVLGKSTYARCGLVVNCTPLEPEWRGKVTMELSNTTPLPIKVYAGEGIAQVYFLRSDEITTALKNIVGKLYTESQGLELNWSYNSCSVSYADRKGRYQDQAGLTHPFVNKGE